VELAIVIVLGHWRFRPGPSNRCSRHNDQVGRCCRSICRQATRSLGVRGWCVSANRQGTCAGFIRRAGLIGLQSWRNILKDWWKVQWNAPSRTLWLTASSA